MNPFGSLGDGLLDTSSSGEQIPLATLYVSNQTDMKFFLAEFSSLVFNEYDVQSLSIKFIPRSLHVVNEISRSRGGIDLVKHRDTVSAGFSRSCDVEKGSVNEDLTT